jgi:hypothetical protein
MSRWKLLDNWDRYIAGLSDEQLRERLKFAKDRESSSLKPGTGRNPKAARMWRQKREAVEVEIERRRSLTE